MKICFITTGDINNIATSKRAFGLANPLAALGYEVHIILEKNGGNLERAKLECNESIKLHYFKKTSLINEPKVKSSIVKSIAPDYLYLCSIVLRNFVKSGGARLLIEHSELQSQIADTKPVKKVVAAILEKWSVLASDGVLCASKYLMNHFSRKSSKNNRKLFYFPYAFSKGLYKVISSEQLESQFTSLKNKTNFVFLGTVTNNYGASLMLKGFNELVEAGHKDVRLIILGKGRHYEDAVHYVKENNLSDNILLPGFIDECDIEKYFSIADAFVSPMQDTVQDWARCPSKLYMYLPYKKPVFTCKIGEPFEVLKSNGIYFLPDDVGSFVNSIKEFLDNKSKSGIADPDLHTWDARASELDNWIKTL